MAGNHMSELSPRQRMINMMYLVLTALLALNVSKEVLDAFHKMDTSIGFSFSEKHDFNKKQYDDFELKALNNPEKLGVWNDVANSVIFLASEEAGYITGQTITVDGGRVIN